MEISYRREMKHNYLIIDPDESGHEGYESRMLVSNSIEGLLRFRLKYLDTKEYYYYDITSRQPLKRLLESRCISMTEIKRLIIQIVQTLDNLDTFLLREEQLLMEPEYIYITPESFDVNLCLVPGRVSCFPRAISELLQYLLGKVDHQDKECVVLAYGLYQESLKDNYGIEDLLKLILKTDTPPQEESSAKCEEIHEEMPVQEKEEGVASERVSHSSSLWRISGFIITNILGFSGLYFILGLYRLLPYGIILFAGSGYIWFYGAKKYESGKKVLKEEPVLESWKLSFDEPEPKADMIAESGCNTVLLANTNTSQEIRKLVSLDGGEDILLPYFPFVIGKQEGIADYVLNKDTVSRLHVRLDHDEDGYKITDLNSTNGTAVNNQMLETNETVYLSSGDEIFVANVRFRFIYA